RQPEPEPALCAVHTPISLDEEIEDAWQELRLDADAAVRDPKERVTAVDADHDLDLSPGRCELRRVGDEVRGDLLDARLVGIDPHRLQPLAPGVATWNGRFAERGKASIDRCRQVDRLAIEQDLSAAHAGDIEEVVHQAGQVANLLGDQL